MKEPLLEFNVSKGGDNEEDYDYYDYEYPSYGEEDECTKASKKRDCSIYGEARDETMIQENKKCSDFEKDGYYCVPHGACKVW